ncbi:WD40/YVTN/BNR-like repeat-containing protein [candidate division KSB1 bacterium]
MFGISHDKGNTWEGYIIDHQMVSTSAIAVDPLNNDHIYASAYGLSDKLENMIYKSTNGGKNWTKLKIHSGKIISIEKILFHPLRKRGEKRLFFSSQYGVYESGDEGHSWSVVYKGSCNSFLISDDGVYYALKNRSLLCSEDNGETWQTIFETEKNQSFQDFHLDEKNNRMFISGYLGLITVDLNEWR